MGPGPYPVPMKFLLLVAVVTAVFLVWKFRVQVIAKLLGQSESRVRRQLGRRRD